MKDVMDLAIVDVEALTLRAVAGEGSQLELVVKTRHGELHVRLIARVERTIRLVDLRARDQRKAKKTRLLTVPFPSQRGG